MKTENIDMDVNTKTAMIKINAPWGPVEFQDGDNVALLKFAKDQLVYYRDVEKQNTEHLAIDIAGYDSILMSADPNKNAGTFLHYKHVAMRKGQRYATNRDVIDAMKKDGVWIDGK